MISFCQPPASIKVYVKTFKYLDYQAERLRPTVEFNREDNLKTFSGVKANNQKMIK
ncbi:hypothetical protein KKB43_03860 [Patescibacteria group bacterium]|nr:hypothetical protein [Patescibacteria group bacterium]